jgi:hypothetical protein
MLNQDLFWLERKHDDDDLCASSTKRLNYVSARAASRQLRGQMLLCRHSVAFGYANEGSVYIFPLHQVQSINPFVYLLLSQAKCVLYQ